MNATPVSKDQRELVRILYMEHGPQRASELANVRYDKVRKWASRYGWANASQSVTRPVEEIANRISDSLAEHERETRLSLARYARRAAKDSESATLRDAPLVHKTAQIAGIVHKWESDKTSTQFTLNVLNINSLDNRLGEQEPTLEA